METVATTPAFLKATRTDVYNIDPRMIVMGNNPREDYGDIESLKNFIVKNGVMSLDAIRVKPVKNSSGEITHYELKHGYRRTTAIMELIAEGVDIARVRADYVKAGYSEEDELAEHFTKNAGKSLTPYEEAKIFQKFTDMGYSQREIADRCGTTATNVNIKLTIMSASKSVREAMGAGLISTTTVYRTIMDMGVDNANKVLEITLKNTDSKVTERTVAKTKNGVDQPRVSKYQRLLMKASSSLVAGQDDEKLQKVEKAREIVTLLESFKGEELIEKLLGVL